MHHSYRVHTHPATIPHFDVEWGSSQPPASELLHYGGEELQASQYKMSKTAFGYSEVEIPELFSLSAVLQVYEPIDGFLCSFPPSSLAIPFQLSLECNPFRLGSKNGCALFPFFSSPPSVSLLSTNPVFSHFTIIADHGENFSI